MEVAAKVAIRTRVTKFARQVFTLWDNWRFGVLVGTRRSTAGGFALFLGAVGFVEEGEMDSERLVTNLVSKRWCAAS